MSKKDADSIGMRDPDIGKKLKSKDDWYSEGNGTDDIGFKALPAGYREKADGGFYFSPGDGFWRTATIYDSTRACMRGLNYKRPEISRYIDYSNLVFSVRCVKD